MHVVDVDDRMRVELPDSYSLVGRARRAPRASGARRAALTDDAVSAALLAAFSEQHLELVRPVDLAPTPAARRATRAPLGKVRLALDVDADEDAVVLLEQDGFFSWQLPTERRDGPARKPRAARAIRDSARSRTVHFEFDVQAVAPKRRTAAQAQRSRFGFAVGPFRAYVLKFATKFLAGKAMAFLERDVHRGLVVLESSAVRDWRKVDDLSGLRVPKGRASRWLLLVHGTFSSTVGSFGGLAATQPGQAFLDAAVEQYDAVIGFDHPTLSLDPLENATDLLGRLARAKVEVPPTIDVVCYSRGALVARSFVEQLLPVADWKAHVDRVVFVGATNAGTKLAEPENWHHFVDLYTNLAAAGARVLSGFGVPVGAAVSGLVQGVGALVKYLVSYAVDDSGVPGLAAMEPDGPFVRRINDTQPGQPSPGTPWYVVSTDFDVSFFDKGQTPGEFPRRLVTLLADGVVDRLIGAANDLVVDTASMSAVDAGVGGFIKDTFAFGKNARVYHTKYFVQPEVCHALIDWFDLNPSTDRPVPPPVPPGAVVKPKLPRAMHTDIVSVPADEAVTHVRARLKLARPAYVVIERPYGRGEMYRYPYTGPDLERQLRGHGGKRRVGDALNVGEYDAAETEELDTGRLTPAGSRAARASTPRVIIEDGRSVAVVALPPPPTPVRAMARAKPPRSARRGRPARGVARNGGGRVPRGAAGGGGGGRRPQRARKPKSTTDAHLRANMPAEVTVGVAVKVVCRLSPDDIAPTAAGATAAGRVKVDRDRQITLRVVAKANVDIVGDGTKNVMLPSAGEVVDVEFDVRPTHPGTCEVWVELRQGQPTLLTLRLRAAATKRAAPVSRRRSSASASVPTATATAIDDIQWFRIVEREKGRGAVYEYEITASDLKILAKFESPLLENRERYVNNVYREIDRRWLSSKKDAKDFEQELRAYGGQLFDELIPPELQRLLWKHRRKLKHVMVLSTERFIPWELVHLKEAGKPLPRETVFLGQLGIVRWLYNAFPQTELHARPTRVRVCCPKYVNPEYDLPETVLEEKFLVDTLRATPVPATESEIRKLLRAGGLDVFHFGGHGRAETNDIANAEILLAGRREGRVYLDASVTPTLVQQHARLGSADGLGPIVVLNACQAARLGKQMSSLGGFAEAFLSRGAAAFVSSLWSVGDAPARTFVETFYTELLAKKTVAQAAVAARKAARAAGDATWLAYVVYAHPAAKLI